MLLAQVAVKVTFAAVAEVGVIVYFKLPQPVGGVEAVIEAHVPANASMDAGVPGVVGVVGVASSFLFRSSQPVVNAQASTKRAVAARSFIDPVYRQQASR